MLEYIVGSVIVIGVAAGVVIRKCNRRATEKILEEGGPYTRLAGV